MEQDGVVVVERKSHLKDDPRYPADDAFIFRVIASPIIPVDHVLIAYDFGIIKSHFTGILKNIVA